MFRISLYYTEQAIVLMDDRAMIDLDSMESEILAEDV